MKPTKYQNRFCGCLQNSEKTTPKDPPNLLMFCMGLRAMKEARYRNKNYTMGITVVNLSIPKKFQTSSSTASYRLQQRILST